MPEAVDQTLTVQFFGVTAQITVPTAGDIAHLRYYLRDHLTTVSRSADVHIRLATEDGSSFVCAIGGQLAKRMWWRLPGQPWTLYEEFRRQAHRPSLVPPFGIRPLRDSVRVRHGGAVAAPAGYPGALAVTGDSGAGKSVAVLHLLREGWRFISDDLLVLDRRERYVHYYGRPIGVRECSLPLLSWIRREELASAPCIATQLGSTYMVRPERLGSCVAPDTRTVLRWRLHLTYGGTFARHRDGTKVRVRWDPHRHLAQLLELCAGLPSSGGSYAD